MSKIIAFAGSTRSASFNKMLARAAANEAEKAGASVTWIDLRDYPLPLFDEDLESAEGAPANATKLYELLKGHSAIILASPEYNSSITGVLKNTIDWVSRPRKDEPPLAAFSGKVAALFSASPGAFAGIRSLSHVRDILSNLGVIVLGTQVSVPKAKEVFAADGSVSDPAIAQRISKLAINLVETTQALRG